jgi:hypothetical protein
LLGGEEEGRREEGREEERGGGEGGGEGEEIPGLYKGGKAVVEDNYGGLRWLLLGL